VGAAPAGVLRNLKECTEVLEAEVLDEDPSAPALPPPPRTRNPASLFGPLVEDDGA